MQIERKEKIAELRWQKERIEKRSIIQPKLKALLNRNSFEILSDKESDDFQLKSDDWPENKWEDELFVQSEITNPKPVEEIVTKMMYLIQGDFLFLFMMNFNFGLIQISKNEFEKKWKELIEIDGDEVYCYDPNSSDFICIEKTEDLLLGLKNEGTQWIYELTFSNKKLKEKINRQ